MSRKQGILVVISGFSGAGKGTLIEALLSKHPYYLSISATTRNPREGEKHGINYFFVSRDEFETMIQEDQLVEYAMYVENYYGTPKRNVEKQLAEGHHVILEIETKGAMQVKKLFPNAILMFITPPTAEELKRRLLNRGTEAKEIIEKRIWQAKEEINYIQNYDYVIINDLIEESVEQIHRIIQSETCHIERSKEFIEYIKNGLQVI